MNATIDVAEIVCALEAAGVRVVLDGGGEVTIDAGAGGLAAETLALLRLLRLEVRDFLKRRAVLAMVRAASSRTLGALDDQRLQALCDWGVLHAFREGGTAGFRPHLPPVLRSLTDAELRALMDIEGVATIEGGMARRLGAGAADIVAAGRLLALWWLAGRESTP